MSVDTQTVTYLKHVELNTFMTCTFIARAVRGRDTQLKFHNVQNAEETRYNVFCLVCAAQSGAFHGDKVTGNGREIAIPIIAR